MYQIINLNMKGMKRKNIENEEEEKNFEYINEDDESKKNCRNRLLNVIFLENKNWRRKKRKKMWKFCIKQTRCGWYWK